MCYLLIIVPSWPSCVQLAVVGKLSKQQLQAGVLVGLLHTYTYICNRLRMYHACNLAGSAFDTAECGAVAVIAAARQAMVEADTALVTCSTTVLSTPPLAPHHIRTVRAGWLNQKTNDSILACSLSC